MSINSDKAFNVGENGLLISDDNGNAALYLAAGIGSPIGNQSGTPTLYVDELGQIWRKTGPLATDWALFTGSSFNEDDILTDNFFDVLVDNEGNVLRGI